MYFRLAILLVLLSANTAWAARTLGSARALATLRASKIERERSDSARQETGFRKTATIVRLRNKTGDADISSRIAAVTENCLRIKGFKIKDYRAVHPIIKKRKFSRFRSSSALRLLGREHLKANLLVFLTIEKCIVTTFNEEYHELKSHGNINVPDEEFIELQVKASVFDVAHGDVIFSRRDRQFVTFTSGNSGLLRQSVFEKTVKLCVANLFGELQ